MNDWPPDPGNPAGFPAMNGPPGSPPHPGFFDPGAPGATPKVRRGGVRAAALALLVEGPRNGYQIIQEITERSHGIWRPSPGSVYPALQQLEDEGLVRSSEEAGRRAYRLTNEGRAHVAEHQDTLAEPWAAVAESVSDDLVDLRALFLRLGAALRQVAQAGTPAQHQRARRVLIDARRSLYLLLAEDPDDDVEGQV